ncbi:hypothetical protein UN63_11450 [Oceanisphaera arctica]|uniref:Uncharacterized protein n=1 Tax=Oceanisphaera arctica TaxID=641510 RepID=A0A2P5TKS3_9GAMM|nr:hypothetical protein UN63_11450 [Oceanisphaera arctica]
MPSDRQGRGECRNGRNIFRPWHFTVVGAVLCCLFLNTELPEDGANRPRRSIKEDEGICFTDHHMTGKSCAERHREVLERVGEAGPLSGIDITVKKIEQTGSRALRNRKTMRNKRQAKQKAPLVERGLVIGV